MLFEKKTCEEEFWWIAENVPFPFVPIRQYRFSRTKKSARERALRRRRLLFYPI
jgi:hypothetical protein